MRLLATAPPRRAAYVRARPHPWRSVKAYLRPSIEHDTSQGRSRASLVAFDVAPRGDCVASRTAVGGGRTVSWDGSVTAGRARCGAVWCGSERCGAVWGAVRRHLTESARGRSSLRKSQPEVGRPSMGHRRRHYRPPLSQGTPLPPCITCGRPRLQCEWGHRSCRCLRFRVTHVVPLHFVCVLLGA